MNSNWFKIWPGQLRTLASSLSSGLHRAYLMQVAIVYLDEGGLPADTAKIAFKTSLPQSTVAEMAEYWPLLGRVEGDRLYLDFLDEIIAERDIFVEKKKEAGRKGGKAKDAKAKESLDLPENANESPAEAESAKQSLAVLDDAKQSEAKPSQTIQTDNTDSKSKTLSVLLESDEFQEPPTSAKAASRNYQQAAAAASRKPIVSDHGKFDFDTYENYHRAISPTTPDEVIIKRARFAQQNGKDDDAVAAWQKSKSARAAPKQRACACDGSGFIFKRNGVALNPPEECTCQQKAK